MNATPYQVMPALSPDEFAALKADIAARGVQVPVEYDEMGNILDGHHRVQACFELGVTHWPRLVRHGLSEAEKRRHARRLNLDRRHLNQEQRRDLIAAELRQAPAASDRAIASGLGVDHKTVGSVRDKLEATGEIPQLEQREGRDNRTRRITQFVPSTPEEEKGLQLSARALNARNDNMQRQARRDLAQALSDTSVDLHGYRQVPCIYADPAWKRKAGVGDRAYENHYPTASWDDIMKLPVKELLLPNAWGFIWIPRAHMLALHPVTYTVEVPGTGEFIDVKIRTPLIWAIARAWGFDAYSTCFVWTKTDEDHPDDMGTGLVVRDQDEILCLFKKGNGLPKPDNDEKFTSNHRERAGEHSRKPQFYRDMIATMTGGVPVLELFARVDVENPLPPNWQAWGNEAREEAV
jgi:N6-adenosine-specific RNA methylase IME4/ParB-like chromosome segregation protein Spo0J